MSVAELKEECYQVRPVVSVRHVTGFVPLSWEHIYSRKERRGTKNWVMEVTRDIDSCSIDVKPSSVTFSNPESLSRSNTMLNPGIRWKHLSDWARCQKAICGIYFTKKWRAETPQPGLEFDNFKPRLKNGIFNCIFWLNGSFFNGDDRGYMKVRAYRELGPI
jgi:hypothetical protein